LGCDRILSSGQQPTAEEGVELLKQLVKKADNRIIVMPGSGINEQNIASIALKTNAKEFHFSARESIKSKMEYRNPNLKLGGTVISIDEYAQNITDSDKVKRTISNLNSTI
ncbi:MAG: copper homeostasis protein CutC, partial [Dysgonamonadaceae bacterium]|nr:copper homeostasis protein CutC [Dysgonamonadaceae bacterium]